VIRKTLFALTLALVGSTAAYAADAPQAEPTASQAEPAASPTVTHLTVTSDYPSEPGPYTVIYREWGDLTG
jgi:hypothetical protein